MAGDNDLSYSMENTIERLEELPENPWVNIVVLWDGRGTNYTSRFIVQPNGQYTIGTNKWLMGELNTGDDATLSEFLSWGQANWPAEHYYVAIMDHGRGTSGMAWDQTSDYDFLLLDEIRQGIREGTGGGSWKIDVLHFDACLMGLVEMAYDLQPYADYWVATQNQGWSLFIQDEYVGVAQANPLIDPASLAEAVSSLYFSSTGIAFRPRTIAAIRLDQVPHVVSSTDALASLLRVRLPSNEASIDQARDRIQKFDSRSSAPLDNDDEYLDLYHLAEVLSIDLQDQELSAACLNLMTAVEHAVIWEGHYSALKYGTSGSYYDLDNAHGLSIYWPPDASWADFERYLDAEVFLCTPEFVWDEFLGEFYHVRSGDVGLVLPEPVIPPMWSLYPWE